MQEFLINNRFRVNPALNEVQDIAEERKTRLEPRVMHVLTTLAANAGTMVTREVLVKEIWNDYGGADEGLTQAVSFLRKVLDDSAKNIIKTIPKKGYLLQASITQPSRSDNTIDKGDSTLPIRRRKHLYLVAGIILIIAVALFGFYFRQNEVSKQPAGAASTETAFPGNYEEEDNNPLTTITTTDSLGNRYRLVMIGDKRPKFYVNDSLQHNQEPYDALIDKLAKELWKRQGQVEKR
jgi:DNA-binding winged helix-turn-helix (wHTH) protein